MSGGQSIRERRKRAGDARLWPAIRGIAARVPLQWRLALSSFFLFAVLLTAVGALIVVAEERILLSNQAQTLHEEAAQAFGRNEFNGIRLVRSDAQPPPPGDLPPDIGPVTTFLVARLAGPNVRVAVLTPSGQEIATSGTRFGPLPVAADPSAISQALGAPAGPYPYSLAADGDGNRQLLILKPLAADGHTVALLQLSTPTTPIDRSVASTRVILVLGIGVALALGALLTFPLINAALRPLVAMERASRRIAGGALSLRLDVPPARDEIGRLARAFNSMVAQLEAVIERQKQFVSDVSHELRTPLTALGGGMEMLLLGADRGDAEAQRRLMRGMYAEVARMNRLVADLLTLTRLDEGRLPMRFEPLDARALLAGVSEQAQQLAQGQRIAVEAPADLPPLTADADRLKQVLLNLVDNALKHTPAAGAVTLAARGERGPAGEGLVIEVRDTGAGIPPEALPHVFDRFYRADPARARTSPRAGGPAGGVGLGLAIARRLVEAHGGTITIASAVGQGTTVTIRLPLRPPGLSASPIALPPPSTSAPGRV